MGRAKKTSPAADSRPAALDDLDDDSRPSFLDDTEDDETLPLAVRRHMELLDFIETNSAEFSQYVYRYESNSASQKTLVGMYDGPNIATDHEIGLKFKKAGLYEVLVHVAWMERGKRCRRIRNLPTMRIGTEYESQAAPVDGAQKPAGELQTFLEIQKGLTQMLVEVLKPGQAVTPQVADVAASDARWRGIVDDMDERLKRQGRVVDGLVEELRAERLKGARVPEKPEGFKFSDLENIGDIAGSVANGVRTVVNALAPAADAGAAP